MYALCLLCSDKCAVFSKKTVVYHLVNGSTVLLRIKNSKNKNALTENKPPPIRMIRISDFGLPDRKRDPDRHQNCITSSLSHALPLHKISSKSVHKFASNPTDRQTNKQTDKQTAPKT